MIDDAIGKILGMAMAYGVSALGLFLAYVNYRRRIVKADKVMTPAAWTVVALIAVGVAGGILVVASLAAAPAGEGAAGEAAAVVSEPAAAPATEAPPATEVPAARPGAGSRWPLLGMVLPAAIFLLATWITAGLYRHFSHAGH
jgi:hypothetical protein